LTKNKTKCETTFGPDKWYEDHVCWGLLVHEAGPQIWSIISSVGTKSHSGFWQGTPLVLENHDNSAGVVAKSLFPAHEVTKSGVTVKT